MDEALKMVEREKVLDSEREKLESAVKDHNASVKKEVDKALDAVRVQIEGEAKESFQLKFKALTDENTKSKSPGSHWQLNDFEMM